MKDINHRSRKILHAVVSEYLTTGEAVGSRRVTRRHGIDLSAATVRNVMADLEEMGLLEQPHTSAGRVPTGSGLRFFIDSLLKVRGLSPKEKEAIRERCSVDEGDFEAVMQRTSRMLSEITQYAGIVLVPNPAEERLEHIEFVRLSAQRVLCIMVTQSGHIENKIVKTDVELERDNIESIHNYLNDILSGLTLVEVRRKVLAELGAEKNQYDEMVASALRLSRAAVESTAAGADIIVSGKANLLAGQSRDEEQLARMRELLRALEEKETIVRLLDQTMTSERVQVFLGAETAHEALGDSSIVAVPYGPDERALGAIAVIGPTRMNYGKVMSVVDFTAELMSRLADSR